MRQPWCNCVSCLMIDVRFDGDRNRGSRGDVPGQIELCTPCITQRGKVIRSDAHSIRYTQDLESAVLELSIYIKSNFTQ